MKNRFFKYAVLTAALLIFAMVVTACGSSSGGNSSGGDVPAAETTAAAAETTVEETTTEETTTEAFTPVGKYTATVDMTAAINTGMAESGFQFQDAVVTADLILELKEDGNFVLDMDMKSLSESVKAAIEKEGVTFFRQILSDQGISEEDMEEVAVSSGYENFDAMAAEMIEELKDELDNSIEESMGDSAHAEGTYTVDGTKLVLSTGEEGEFTGNNTFILNAQVTGIGLMEMEFSK